MMTRLMTEVMMRIMMRRRKSHLSFCLDANLLLRRRLVVLMILTILT